MTQAYPRFTLLVFVYVFCASNQFFGLLILSDSFISAANRISIALLAGLFFIDIPNTRSRDLFKTGYVIVVFGILTNTLYSNLQNSVPIASTLLAYLPFLYILIYTLLIRTSPSIKFIESTIISLAIAYATIYLIQMSIFPKAIIRAAATFDIDSLSDTRDSRGTLRFRGPGGGVLMLGYFLTLGRYFISKKSKYLILSVGLFSVLIFGGFRSLFAAGIISTILMFFALNRITPQAIAKLTMLSAILFITFSITGATSIIEKMLEETKSQNVTSSDYIRQEELRYFLFSYPKNILSYVFGSGFPSVHLDKYTSELLRLGVEKGYYWQDIGVIGLSIIAGPFVTIGLLFIVFKSTKTQVNPSALYCRYFLLYLVFGSITSMEMFRPGMLGVIGVAMYIFYIGTLPTQTHRLTVK